MLEKFVDLNKEKRKKIKLYEKFQTFIDLFSECRLTIRETLDETGLTMKDFLELKRSNAYFRTAVEQILNERALLVEEANYNSALSGSVEAQKFFLKNRDQDRWRDKIESDVNNRFTFDTPEKQLNAVFGILGIKDTSKDQVIDIKNAHSDKDYMEEIETDGSSEEVTGKGENKGV